MTEHQPIPPEIQKLAKEYGIDTVKNLNTGDYRDAETGAIFHRIEPPERLMRPALFPEEPDVVEFSLQS